MIKARREASIFGLPQVRHALATRFRLQSPEKATQAGVRRSSSGWRNTIRQPDGGEQAPEQDHRIPASCCRKWRQHGAITYAGYILGFPGDTKGPIKRDIEIIKRELPLDILESSSLTPLPGSEDHKGLWTKGVWMDPDMNKYDLNHRVAASFPRCRNTNGRRAYKAAWETYYTPEHIRTILRRRRRQSARPAQDHALHHPVVLSGLRL